MADNGTISDAVSALSNAVVSSKNIIKSKGYPTDNDLADLVGETRSVRSTINRQTDPNPLKMPPGVTFAGQVDNLPYNLYAKVMDINKSLSYWKSLANQVLTTGGNSRRNDFFGTENRYKGNPLSYFHQLADKINSVNEPAKNNSYPADLPSMPDIPYDWDFAFLVRGKNTDDHFTFRTSTLTGMYQVMTVSGQASIRNHTYKTFTSTGFNKDTYQSSSDYPDRSIPISYKNATIGDFSYVWVFCTFEIDEHDLYNPGDSPILAITMSVSNYTSDVVSEILAVYQNTNLLLTYGPLIDSPNTVRYMSLNESKVSQWGGELASITPPKDLEVFTVKNGGMYLDNGLSFNGCSKLRYIDNTYLTKAGNMSGMFNGCISLTQANCKVHFEPEFYKLRGDMWRNSGFDGAYTYEYPYMGAFNGSNIEELHLLLGLETSNDVAPLGNDARINLPNAKVLTSLMPLDFSAGGDSLLAYNYKLKKLPAIAPGSYNLTRFLYHNHSLESFDMTGLTSKTDYKDFVTGCWSLKSFTNVNIDAINKISFADLYSLSTLTMAPGSSGSVSIDLSMTSMTGDSILNFLNSFTSLQSATIGISLSQKLGMSASIWSALTQKASIIVTKTLADL